MQQVIDYLIEQYGKPQILANDAAIAASINKFSLAERNELRSRLFHEARVFELENRNGQAFAWLEYCFETIENCTFRFHKVYFSPGLDILENMIDLLEQSQKTIDLCVFTITDSRLAECIFAAQHRGVAIRLITDDRKLYDHGSEGYAFHKAGIPVKIDHSQYHMHHKFGIIDGRIVFTGSFNWTYTASKHNHENLLVTSKKVLIEQYQTEFDRLWNEMYDL
ncbi:MAG: phospholipase D-like domain-containing protein [Mangrovibacterium sp.]